MKEKVRKSCMSMFLFCLMGILSLATSYAQSGSVGTISGNVKDSQGEAIIGASVVVKGTTTGTVTDFDGNFQINASAGNTLVISYIGYKPQDVAVGNQKRINIVMQDDAELLGEVVVIGYGSVKKDDATGSVVAIKADEINRGLVTSATDLVLGRIAGVNVNTAGGEPGAGASIRIRGGSSLTATNNPLIVIDGIPMNSEGPGGMSNPLSLINPYDIETFTVLKDASATAIYGSRASNGVIIITTKKGSKNQKLKVAYNGNVAFSKNQKTIDVLNANEYRSFIDEHFSKSADYGDIIGLLGDANTNWQDEIFRTGVTTDHNLSFLGSVNDFLPFRASLGYTDQNGTLLNSNFERYTGGLSLTPSLFDKHLNISLNANGSYSQISRSDVGAVGAAASFDPTQVVRNGSPFGGYFTWTETSKDGDGNTIEIPRSIATKNPLAMLNMKDDLTYVRTFVGNAQFDYKLHFFPDLKVNMNLGLDYADSNGKTITDPQSPMEYTTGGYNKRWTATRKNSLMDFYGQYLKDVQSIESKFDVMGGYSWQHFRNEGTQSEHRITKLDENGKPIQINPDNNYAREYYLISFFGRFNYTFKDKYLLTATVRKDGTSRFAENNRWGTFPAFALGWKMKEETFLKDVSVLSEMKLRMGWGITGQQDLGDDFYYPSQALYTMSQGQAYYLMGNDATGKPVWVPVIRPSAYNKDLKWEQTKTYNIGVDYGFLNNRISGAIDYYYRKTTDLLNREVKVAAGANVGEFVASNIGTLVNKGLEFSVNSKPIVTRDFVWDLSYNISWNKSEITYLNSNSPDDLGKPQGWVGGDGGTYSQMHSVGQAPYAFYVYEQIYNEQGKPIEGMYVDQNGDGVINEKDKIFFKKPAPDVMMGFSSKFNYKDWDFGFNGRVSLGNYVYNGVEATHANVSISGVYSNGFTSNVYRSAVANNFQSKQLLSSYYVQNASFLKLDNLTLGYTFNNVLGRNIMARVYGSVQNVFTITPYSGLDPEVNGTDAGQSGIDNNVYPRPTSFLFGVNLNF